MKDFKVRQILYNKLTPHDDLVTDITVISEKKIIIEYGIKYFEEDLTELIYPSKSYSVAIIYAYLLQKHFNEDFFESLNDPELFCSNDRFFVPYALDPQTYDAIIKGIGLWEKDFCLNTTLLQVATSIHYFSEEFGVQTTSG